MTDKEKVKELQITLDEILSDVEVTSERLLKVKDYVKAVAEAQKDRAKKAEENLKAFDKIFTNYIKEHGPIHASVKGAEGEYVSTESQKIKYDSKIIGPMLNELMPTNVSVREVVEYDISKNFDKGIKDGSIDITPFGSNINIETTSSYKFIKDKKSKKAVATEGGDE